MSEHEPSNLLERIYTCPTDRSHWPGVLDQVCRSVGARSAAAQVLSRGSDRALLQWSATDSNSASDRRHDDEFVSGARNPRFKSPTGLRQRGAKMFMRDADFFASGNRDLAELHRRLAKIGLGSFLSAGIPLSKESVLVLALHRNIDDRSDFSEKDEAYLAALMPHLRQAMALSQKIDRLQRHAADLQQAADHIRCGIVICDENADIGWCNSAAQRILARNACVRAKRGRLTAVSQQGGQALRRLIAVTCEADVERTAPPYLLLSDAAALSTLQVLAIPLHQPGDASRGPPSRRAMLLIGDPSISPPLPTEVIAHLFGLSPTESRLTAAMCQGMTVNEYAAAHGVSAGTARYQLKQIFAKTQTTRQANLVLRVCMSVAGHAIHAVAES